MVCGMGDHRVEEDPPGENLVAKQHKFRASMIAISECNTFARRVICFYAPNDED